MRHENNYCLSIKKILILDENKYTEEENSTC